MSVNTKSNDAWIVISSLMHLPQYWEQYIVLDLDSNEWGIQHIFLLYYVSVNNKDLGHETWTQLTLYTVFFLGGGGGGNPIFFEIFPPLLEKFPNPKFWKSICMINWKPPTPQTSCFVSNFSNSKTPWPQS